MANVSQLDFTRSTPAHPLVRRVKRFALAAALLLSAPAMVQAEGAAKPDLISIGGSVTEIIYALGQEHRLLGRDRTSSYPAAALELPDVGYMRALSPEGVLSLGPKLIVAEAGSGPVETVEVLKGSSVEYAEIPETFSPEGVADKIRAVGAALEVEEQAEVLAQGVLSDLAAVREKVASDDGVPKKVLFVLSTRGDRIMAGGRNTAADAIIELAGGKNIITSFEGYKPVTNEAILAAGPEVILMMSRAGHSASNDELWKMPALALTPAKRNDAVVRMDGLLLLGFGPRIPDAIARLHEELAG